MRTHEREALAHYGSFDTAGELAAFLQSFDPALRIEAYYGVSPILFVRKDTQGRETDRYLDLSAP
jgi:hypothetical protein